MDNAYVLVGDKPARQISLPQGTNESAPLAVMLMMVNVHAKIQGLLRIAGSPIYPTLSPAEWRNAPVILQVIRMLATVVVQYVDDIGGLFSYLASVPITRVVMTLAMSEIADTHPHLSRFPTFPAPLMLLPETEPKYLATWVDMTGDTPTLRHYQPFYDELRSGRHVPRNMQDGMSYLDTATHLRPIASCLLSNVAMNSDPTHDRRNVVYDATTLTAHNMLGHEWARRMVLRSLDCRAQQFSVRDPHAAHAFAAVASDLRRHQPHEPPTFPSHPADPAT